MSSEPTQPKQIGHFKTGSTGTHRNFYDGGNLVHAAAGAPGLNGKIYRSVDISDSSNPREVGRFSLTGTSTGRDYEWPKIFLPWPGAYRRQPRLSFLRRRRRHHPRRTDMAQPKMISQLAFRGITATQGIHTYLPLPRRKIALINDEAIRENGDENLNLAGIVDISDEKRPRMLSLFPLPEPPVESELKNFYEKAGRFGPHNHHHPNHQACLEDRDDVAYLTYFNAGLRVYDIRDARQPKEIGYFVPADPLVRIGTKPSQLVAQSEDVLVDRRGCIYLSDKTHGIHILRLDKIWPYQSA